MALAPGTTIGPYEIVSAIGAGGMGEVYRARDRRLNRQVALKLLPTAVANDAGRRARFTREAHLLASLNHTNIAQLYGFEEPAAGSELPPALVMELVEGGTLADRIASGPLPLDQALAIATQLADALEYAHAAGVIHRDLKPANIKVRADGTVKVLDFGLAKVLDPGGHSDASAPADTPTMAVADTEPGVVLGTAAYMAPEQVHGRPADKRADIWSFGVVLFEMLSGRQMFTGTSTGELMAAVIRDDPPWTALPVSTPAHVRAVLRRCLERDPRRRLRDIGDARLLLEGGDAITPAPDVRRRSLHAFIWPAVALLATAVVVAALVARFSRGENTSPLPLRFTVPQPPEVAFNHQNLFLTLAVAPHGDRIVLATPAGLLVWSAATGITSMLDDTAGAIAPFFSPDGEQIGFFARDELKRIAVGGGPATVITRAPAGSSGTWGADDTVLYTRWLGREIGLWQVPAKGGESRLVAAASNVTELHAFPKFLPDARHYLFLRGGYATAVGEREICVGSVDGGPPECLVPGDSQAEYSPTGHVIFVRAGTLVALPFDVRARRATAAPVTVASATRWFGPVGAAAFAVSADGRVLVHAPPPRPRRLLWLDRTGKQIADVGVPRLYNQVQLSRDGTRAAVDIWNKENGGRDLWLIDLATGSPTRVTVEPVDVYLGSWSVDEQSLIYGKPSAVAPPDLYEIALIRGESRPLLALPGVQHPQHVSPDGTLLAYLESFTDRYERHIWLLPRGGKPRPLRETPANTFDPRFSPDGRMLAYASDESGAAEVYVLPLTGSTTPRRVSRHGGFFPRWRGDGRELFFFQVDGTLMAAELGAASRDPRPLFRIDGVTPSDIHSPPQERFAAYDVTADGQRFLMRLVEDPGGRSDDLRVWVNWASAIR
jgi:hypothetical protein